MRNLSNFSFKTSWWISSVSRSIDQFKFSYWEFSFWKLNAQKVYSVNKNTFDTPSCATKTHLKQNSPEQVTEWNKRIREKYQNKNRRHYLGATIQGIGRSNMAITVDRATKECSKVLNFSRNMSFPNQSMAILQTISRL